MAKQLPAQTGNTTSLVLPFISDSALRERLSSDDMVYLDQKQKKLSTVTATRQRAEGKAARLKRKIESTPEYQELEKLRKNIKAMKEAEKELGTQVSAILEKSMPDVEGDDLHSKFATLARGGVR